MRSLRICLLALVAALLLGAPSAQAADQCGLAPFPTLGNLHRLVGQPVTYDLTNNNSQYFDVLISWGDEQFSDGPGFYPGDTSEFSHSYSSAGTYRIAMYVRTADAMGFVCTSSVDLGTIRVRGRGPR